MSARSGDRRERLRAMLADLKMPGALEAVDGILAAAASGAVTAAEAIEKLLASHIVLRNNRQLPHPRHQILRLAAEATREGGAATPAANA